MSDWLVSLLRERSVNQIKITYTLQIDPESEVQLTYRQILEQSARVASGLAKLGLTKSDNVAIVSENCLEYCFAMFGSIFVAAPLALLNPAYVEGKLVSVFSSDWLFRLLSRTR